MSRGACPLYPQPLPEKCLVGTQIPTDKDMDLQSESAVKDSGWRFSKKILPVP